MRADVHAADPEPATTGEDGELRTYTHETALHKAARGGHGQVVDFLLREAGAGADHRCQATLRDVLDTTKIVIRGAGDQAANGEYERTTDQGAGRRPEYRHCDPENGRNTIQWSFYSHQWILDQPGPALYCVPGRNDFEFPYDGEWSFYQGQVPPLPVTAAEESRGSRVSREAALHLAARLGHLDAVRALVAGGADVDARESCLDRTALHLACDSGHLPVVELLASQAKADLSAADQQGCTALLLAAARGHAAVARFLILEAKADASAKDRLDRTALHLACEAGSLDVARLLVSEASGDVEAVDADNATPLLRAAERGHLGVVRYLVAEAGANSDASDAFDNTPILRASSKGYSDVVRVLATDGNASTLGAVNSCVHHGQIECAFVLWSAGTPMREDGIAGLCRTLQLRHRFGRLDNLTWASLRGPAKECLRSLLGDAVDWGRAVLLHFGIARSCRDRLVDAFMDTPCLGDSCHSWQAGADPGDQRSNALQFLSWSFDGAKHVSAASRSLEAELESQADGLLVLVPPGSLDVCVLVYSRKVDDQCPGPNPVVCTGAKVQDGVQLPPHSESSTGLDPVLQNVVHAANALNLSRVDFSYHPSLEQFAIDPFLGLESLRSFICRGCPRLKTILALASPETYEDCMLEQVDFSENKLLESLPLHVLLELPVLRVLACKECSVLFTPPQEICRQGGRITLDFLREVKEGGQLNQHMTLFLIGDGESGKTSTFNALRSQSNASERIHEDRRTVGIDISEWAPEGVDVVFKTFDLAGQAVYGKTHQLFLQRRAVYMLVWRAHESLVHNGDALSQRVLRWMDSLQNRMPGSHLILVVTHIDAVSADILAVLCDRVHSLVVKRLQSMTTLADGRTPVIHVFNNGESFRVNCLTGDGIKELREGLVRFTKSMPWYGEGLPKSWVDTQQALLQCVERGKHFLEWSSYARLAEEHGLEYDMLPVATRFFHEAGIIRYFGELQIESDEPEEPEEQKGYIRGNRVCAELQDTVFISAHFMINVMKGLIRHDRDSLLCHFMEEQNRVMMRRLNRLSVCGRMHRSLVPYLWPCLEQGSLYWKKVRGLPTEEGLWPADVVTTQADADRAVALLEGFDLLACRQAEDEIVVPGILSETRLKVSGDAFNGAECALRLRFSYLALPDGAFESIVVRLAKDMTSIEYSASAAVLYYLGHIGQICQVREGEGDVHLCLAASSKVLLDWMKNEVLVMEAYFPGLIRRGLEDPESNKKHVESPQVAILACDVNHALAIREHLQNCGCRFTVALQLPYSEDYRGVIILTEEEEEQYRYHAERLARRFPGKVELKNIKKVLGEMKFEMDEEDIIKTLGTEVTSMAESLLMLIKELNLLKKLKELQQTIFKARVVVACVTPGISSCENSCLQFAEHVNSRRAVVPVIMGAYELARGGKWWPNTMSGFENHKLYLDFRDPLTLPARVECELIPQIHKYLVEWRAGPGSETSCEPSLPLAAEIRCPKCERMGFEDGGSFAIGELLKCFEEYVARRYEEGHSEQLRRVQCGTCSTSHDVHDLLTLPRRTDVVPCPRCLASGRFPPGCFDVEDCRVRLGEADRLRAGVVSCTVCRSQIKIIDVAPREVFGSYNWGEKLEGDPGGFSTQRLVVPLLQRVEELADVLCWVDVVGGMGAGQDHLDEMRRGVEAARVFVVFLSDAYVLSENCLREFLHATRSARFLIPVLVPDSGHVANGVSAGWTGPGKDDPEWWRHAENLTRCAATSRASCAAADAIETSPVSLDPDWSVLADAEPVSLENIQGAADEIVRRVMSRLHRSVRLNNNTWLAKRRMAATMAWRALAAAVDGELRAAGDAPAGSQGTAADIGGATEEDEAALRAVFELLDTDGSNRLCRRELRAALGAAGGAGSSPSSREEWVDKLLERFDADRSGTIEFREFLEARRDAILFQRSARAAIDASFDFLVGPAACPGTGPGKISQKRLEWAASRLESVLGRTLSADELQGMMGAADLDEDGGVSREEYVDVLRRAGCFSS